MAFLTHMTGRAMTAEKLTRLLPHSRDNDSVSQRITKKILTIERIGLVIKIDVFSYEIF